MADDLDEDLVSDIFVGTNVIIHTTKEEKPDEKVILAALKKHKQKAKGKLRKDDEFIL